MTTQIQKQTDLCLICSEYMGACKNGLGNITQYSRRPLFNIIETFMFITISHSDLENFQICSMCLIKINELDEHHVLVEKIQQELIELYNNSVDLEDKPDFKVETIESLDIIEDDDEPLDFEIPLPKIDESLTNIKKDPKITKLSSKLQFVPTTRKSKFRSTDLHQYDPTGFEVTEIDGRNHYKCEVCGKVVVQRPQVHRMLHSNEKRFKCADCGEYFRSAVSLNGHKKRHHKARVYYYCDLCDKKFLTRSHLVIHMEGDHLNSTFMCDICGKTFSKKVNLKIHRMIHTGEKKYACHNCPFKTHTKGKLHRHMKTHNREIKYFCEICGRGFYHSYNVTAHINHVHKGMAYKPVDPAKLNCSICGKRFKRQKLVKEHMEAVHANDPKKEKIEGGEDNEEDDIIEWLEEY